MRIKGDHIYKTVDTVLGTEKVPVFFQLLLQFGGAVTSAAEYSNLYH